MPLKFAMKDFKDEKEFANLSPRTIQSYMTTLHEFQPFSFERKLIDTRDIRKATKKQESLIIN